MSEYIEREAAIGMAISGRIRALPTTEDGEDWIRVEEVRESLKNIPAADVVEVKHGRWIIDRAFGNDVLSGEKMVICSVCHKGIFWGKQNYCPNCGAKMDGGADDETV